MNKLNSRCCNNFRISWPSSQPDQMSPRFRTRPIWELRLLSFVGKAFATLPLPSLFIGVASGKGALDAEAPNESQQTQQRPGVNKTLELAKVGRLSLEDIFEDEGSVLDKQPVIQKDRCSASGTVSIGDASPGLNNVSDFDIPKKCEASGSASVGDREKIPPSLDNASHATKVPVLAIENSATSKGPGGFLAELNPLYPEEIEALAPDQLDLQREALKDITNQKNGRFLSSLSVRSPNRDIPIITAHFKRLKGKIEELEKKFRVGDTQPETDKSLVDTALHPQKLKAAYVSLLREYSDFLHAESQPGDIIDLGEKAEKEGNGLKRPHESTQESERQEFSEQNARERKNKKDELHGEKTDRGDQVPTETVPWREREVYGKHHDGRGQGGQDAGKNRTSTSEEASNREGGKTGKDGTDQTTKNHARTSQRAKVVETDETHDFIGNKSSNRTGGNENYLGVLGGHINGTAPHIVSKPALKQNDSEKRAASTDEEELSTGDAKRSAMRRMTKKQLNDVKRIQQEAQAIKKRADEVKQQATDRADRVKRQVDENLMQAGIHMEIPAEEAGKDVELYEDNVHHVW